EHEQGDPDDRDELLQPVEREAVLGRGGGDRRGRDGGGDRVVRRRSGDEDAVDLVPALEDLLRGLQVEDGGRRDAQRLHAAEAGDADDGEVVRTAAGRDLDLVAEAVALVLGGRRV